MYSEGCGAAAGVGVENTAGEVVAVRVEGGMDAAAEGV